MPETGKKTETKDFNYDEHAKQCVPGDFWGQVRRTVNGKPVSEEQINMIVSAITSQLEIDKKEFLLDICCGNGALTSRVFAQCAGGLGVDMSAFLIQVANESFVTCDDESFLESDVIEYLKTETHPERFTKALCYGSFQFLTKDQALVLLREARARFVNVERLLVGNVPNQANMGEFFRPDEYKEGMENDPNSPIGIWYQKEELMQMAKDTGWDVGFSVMPSEYHAAHYRMDVLFSAA